MTLTCHAALACSRSQCTAPDCCVLLAAQEATRRARQHAKETRNEQEKLRHQKRSDEESRKNYEKFLQEQAVRLAGGEEPDNELEEEPQPEMEPAIDVAKLLREKAFSEHKTTVAGKLGVLPANDWVVTQVWPSSSARHVPFQGSNVATWAEALACAEWQPLRRRLCASVAPLLHGR